MSCFEEVVHIYIILRARPCHEGAQSGIAAGSATVIAKVSEVEIVGDSTADIAADIAAGSTEKREKLESTENSGERIVADSLVRKAAGSGEQGCGQGDEGVKIELVDSFCSENIDEACQSLKLRVEKETKCVPILDGITFNNLLSASSAVLVKL